MGCISCTINIFSNENTKQYFPSKVLYGLFYMQLQINKIKDKTIFYFQKHRNKLYFPISIAEHNSSNDTVELLFAIAVFPNAPAALIRKILVLLNLSTELLKEISVPIFCQGKYAQNYSSSFKCSSKLTQENIGTPEPFSRAPEGNSSANILSREIRSRQQQHYYFFQKSPTLKKS